MNYSRVDIEGRAKHERPLIRWCITKYYTTEKGQRDSFLFHTLGKILVDGNNPWLIIRCGNHEMVERFSWGLILEVLNNPRLTPIHFTKEINE